MLLKIMNLGCFLAVATLANAQKIGHLDATGTPILDLNEKQLTKAVTKRIEGDVLKNYTLKAETNDGKTFYYLAAERFKNGNIYSKIAFPLTEKNGKIALLSQQKGCIMECIGANCEMTVKVPCQTILATALTDKDICNTKVTFK